MKHDREARLTGDQQRRSTGTGRPVHAGGPNGCAREARPRGRPGIDNTTTCLEAGPCRRPSCKRYGKPVGRETHNEDQQRRGGRSTPEAPMRRTGKPVHAGGPTPTIQRHTRKPVHAGGQTKCNREARRSGRPIRATNKDEDTGLSRRPQGVCVCTGSPLMRGAQCGLHERIHENRTTQEANCKHNREAQREGESQQ